MASRVARGTHVKGVQRRGQDHPADIDLEGKEIGRTEIAPQAERPPVVNEKGLHPTLHPTRALAVPGHERHRRFLVGTRRDRRCLDAAPRQPQPEIGILGDVEGVPAADPPEHVEPEMVGRAAERHRENPSGRGPAS